MSKAPIYQFYEAGIIIPDSKDNYKYKCKYCFEHNILTKQNETVYIRAVYPTSSNLLAHLKQPNHEQVLSEYIVLKDKEKSLHIGSQLAKNPKIDVTPCLVTESPQTPKNQSIRPTFFGSQMKSFLQFPL